MHCANGQHAAGKLLHEIRTPRCCCVELRNDALLTIGFCPKGSVQPCTVINMTYKL